MKKYAIRITLVLIIGMPGCKADPDNPTSGNNFPSFSGYTATDHFGAPMGLNDPTDWTHDSKWRSGEELLFPELKDLVHDLEPYSAIQIYPAYPNPSSSTTNIQLSKESDVRFSFRVVNKYFNILASSDSVYATSFALNTTAIISPMDTMVRVYYFFERNDSCLYKGHGDLKVN